MPDISRHLITTADERTWKFDRPVIFLGEWCCVYDRSDIWSRMDAIVADPFGLGLAQKDEFYAQARGLEQHIFPVLCEVLNRYHDAQHGHRFWKILLGHWFRRYVDVVFNRFRTIEKCLKSYNISSTTALDDDCYHLATLDSHSFLWACNDNQWNNILYARILSRMTERSFLIDTIPNENHAGFRLLPKSGSARSSKRNIVKEILIKAASLMSDDDYAFIINSYLPFSQEIRLQLALGQIPQIWRRPESDSIFAPDRGLRQMLSERIVRQTGDTLADVLCALVFELMPVCYLEGFAALTEQVNRLSWPKKPKFIFTSNNYDTDELFKSWAAAKVEMGVPYFIGQHGNHGTNRYMCKSVEEEISDKFLTWGWTDGLPQHTPAFVFRGVGRRDRCYDKNGGLLLIEVFSGHRIKLWDNIAEFSEYWSDQQKFVQVLGAGPRQGLTIRLHGASRLFPWSEELRWKKFAQDLTVEMGNRPIAQLIASSRIVVHSYDSCGIIETLKLNIPTLVFWQCGLEHLRESAKPSYQLLIDAGILHLTAESAAKKVNEVWSDVEGWWSQVQVQNARQLFCERYARQSDRPIRHLKKLLSKTEVNGRR